MYQKLNQLNIVKFLQIAAIAVFAAQAIAATWPMINTFVNAPFTFGLFASNIFSWAVRMATTLFDPLILLALAEIIKAKKAN